MFRGGLTRSLVLSIEDILGQEFRFLIHFPLHVSYRVPWWSDWVAAASSVKVGILTNLVLLGAGAPIT